ncbi:uncharacterized protein [Acropora muricata]|uniref:uncharacterized protein n=1 Tax=Acropora muricata TaxID=159855 RepID=UPI0034E3B25E
MRKRSMLCSFSLKSGRVRVTCKTAEYRDDLLEGSTFLFGDVPIPVTAADQSVRFVFVRDLPLEVPDDDVKSVFERFGVVHSISPCFFRDFPSVSNGTRRLVMSFREAIPSSVSVVDFPVRVFPAGQCIICSVCHESGHLPRACACVASSQVTWPETVRRPGARLVPVPVLLCLPRLPCLFPLVSLRHLLLSRPPLCHPPCLLLCHLFSPSRKSFQKLLLKIERSPNPRRLAPLHLFRPVSLLLLSSRLLLLFHLYRHPPPSHPCLAVLLLLGIRMSSELSVAGASSPRPAVSPRPPRTSSADFKRLIRLVVPKIKLGSDVSVFKKQCIALAKSHKLNVSAEECSRIASSVCSGNSPRQMTDLFPADYVIQVRNSLIEELNNVPAVQFIDVAVFTSKFMSTHSVPSRFRATILGQVCFFVNSKTK